VAAVHYRAGRNGVRPSDRVRVHGALAVAADLKTVPIADTQVAMK